MLNSWSHPLCITNDRHLNCVLRLCMAVMNNDLMMYWNESILIRCCKQSRLLCKQSIYSHYKTICACLFVFMPLVNNNNLAVHFDVPNQWSSIPERTTNWYTLNSLSVYFMNFFRYPTFLTIVCACLFLHINSTVIIATRAKLMVTPTLHNQWWA